MQPYSRPLFSSRRPSSAPMTTSPLIRPQTKLPTKLPKRLRRPKLRHKALSMWVASTSFTRPSPARLRSARPTNRTRSLAWTASRRPPASLPSTCPRSRKTQLLSHASFTWLTSRRTRRPRTGPSPSSITAVRAARPSGCTWARSAQSTWSPAATSTCPPRLTSLWTTPTRCSTPATWFSSTCPAPASDGSSARTRGKPSGASMRTPTPTPALSPGSSRSTAAGTRPSSSLARATELRAPPSWPTSWRTTPIST